MELPKGWIKILFVLEIYIFYGQPARLARPKSSVPVIIPGALHPVGLNTVSS